MLQSRFHHSLPTVLTFTLSFLTLFLSLLIVYPSQPAEAEQGLVPTGSPDSERDGFVSMFNENDFENWYTFIPEYGKNNDPDNVFSISEGVIHVTGQHFGYLATEKTYGNYHLKLEFKWGEEKWPPRLEEKRDSGICFHFPADEPDQVWPKSVECQIQEGDVGDFWLIGGSTVEVDGERNEPGDFIRIQKKRDTELPNGEWNTVEVITYDGACTFLVNGVVVNHGENASLKEGRILLQSEGAEIDFRNVMIKEL